MIRWMTDWPVSRNRKFIVKFKKLVVLPSLLLAMSTACNNANKSQPASKSMSSGISEMASSPKADQVATRSSQTQALPDPMTSTVKETMDAGGYTYLRLANSNDEVWAAARRFSVKVGDEVEIGGLMPMAHFKSPSLDRTFNVIQFVTSARILGGDGSAETAPATYHGSHVPQSPIPSAAHDHSTSPHASQSSSNIQKLADGLSVAELFEKSAALNGQKVKFRGRVVKANRNILNRNWLHIQDGTGSDGTNDITVTSANGYAKVGSIVVVEGTLGLNRDFGAGYSYDVIIEDATISSGDQER